jgi:alpha-glucosidase (family GH31 glycosyl hydrolase)
MHSLTKRWPTPATWIGALLHRAPYCLALLSAHALAAPIHFAGQPAELVVSEVSERTLRLVLTPAGASPIQSTVLVPFPSTEILRARDLPGEKELRVGELRVIVKPQPLSFSIRRADGKLVQELTFPESTNGAVSFRTEAPLFGLGEGAQQFDRRGALYPMEPGWGAWNRPVLGSVVPSPFLIGADGWALFAHRPEGQFDLRDGKGTFIPKTNAPLDLFVTDVPRPPDALTEYIRLTGRPVMPPKWALGYFQSHRTLAGPQEPLEIARTFREKKLPCEALIYLGTGYCTNGWNTGHGSLAFNTNAFVSTNIQALHDQNFKVVFHVTMANLLPTAMAPTQKQFGFACSGSSPPAA